MITPNPYSGCGHQAEAVDCHRSALMACCNHFTELSTLTLGAASPRLEDLQPDGSWALVDGAAFGKALQHLNEDGYLVSAYYTWMAMLGRYAAADSEDRMEAVNRVPPGVVPPDGPAYLHRVLSLSRFACRAAVLGDADTVQTALDVIRDEADPDALTSFLLSMCGSAAISIETNPSCTVEHIAAYHVLGSQVNTKTAYAVLPYVVEMVVAHQNADPRTAVFNLRALADLPGMGPIVEGVDVVARALAQLTSSDATVMVTDGPPTAGGSITGLVDIDHAQPGDVHPELMAGVWAMRAAHAYGGATTTEDAVARLCDVARSYGDGLRFGLDVLMKGTQMLGYMAAADAAEEDAGVNP